jgi:hypothetical protein
MAGICETQFSCVTFSSRYQVFVLGVVIKKDSPRRIMRLDNICIAQVEGW